MERAKRLERDGQNSQDAAAPNTCASVESPGALGDAHDEQCLNNNAPEWAPDRLEETIDDAELRKVIAAWPKLNRKLKVAILAVVSVS
jgi:hypothetical protein